MPRPTNLKDQTAANFVALASVGSDVGSGVYALTASGAISFMQASSRDLERVCDLNVNPLCIPTACLVLLKV